MTQKLCTECRYYAVVGKGCDRHESRSPVDGSIILLDCEDERASFPRYHCGPQARFYQAKTKDEREKGDHEDHGT